MAVETYDAFVTSSIYTGIKGNVLRFIRIKRLGIGNPE